MKTILSLIAAAAFAALIMLPYAAEIAVSVSFAASLALIFAADYGRLMNRQPEYCSPRRTREPLRLAA